MIGVTDAIGWLGRRNVSGQRSRPGFRDGRGRDGPRAGVEIVCLIEAHSMQGLGHMAVLVATARRGSGDAADIVNSGPVRASLA